MATHNDIGKLGEDIALRWLITHGHTLVERNYRRPWGELDIVTRETSGKVHFVEVKSVSYETKSALEHAVSHETWRPEDHFHIEKQKRMKRTIESWIAAQRPSDYQVDLITVRMVSREKYASVQCFEHVILPT